MREIFVPLTHPPGQAQSDFGQTWAVIAEERRGVHYFVMSLPQRGGVFAKAYPAETTEAFCDGHVSASGFLDGVPQSILYDNTKLAVASILGSLCGQTIHLCLRDGTVWFLDVGKGEHLFRKPAME